jgi:acetyltransferase-like isoleucine patch superfamily enzyme
LTIGARFQAQSRLDQKLFGIIQPNLFNIVVPGSEIEIGNDASVSGSTISAAKKITIGNRVLIGSGGVICDNGAQPILPKERKDHTKIVSKPIIFEDNLFIGARTIILKDVTIGKGSVIGAGSVVTKTIPPIKIVAENPASIVKSI